MVDNDISGDSTKLREALASNRAAIKAGIQEAEEELGQLRDRSDELEELIARGYATLGDDASNPPIKQVVAVDVDKVWNRIIALSGKAFHQLRGKEFTYEARGRTIYLHTTNRMISRAAIEQALERVPLSGPSEVQDLSAPSYIYGILMDRRVRQASW